MKHQVSEGVEKGIVMDFRWLRSGRMSGVQLGVIVACCAGLALTTGCGTTGRAVVTGERADSRTVSETVSQEVDSGESWVRAGFVDELNASSEPLAGPVSSVMGSTRESRPDFGSRGSSADLPDAASRYAHRWFLTRI